MDDTILAVTAAWSSSREASLARDPSSPLSGSSVGRCGGPCLTWTRRSGNDAGRTARLSAEVSDADVQ